MPNDKIHIINGDVLNVQKSIICHQVNCLGIMGGGVAKQIKDKYPNVFTEYKKLCESVSYKDCETKLLGTCQIIKCSDTNYVANLFGQREIGYNAIHTRYDAFTEAVRNLMISVTAMNSEYSGLSIVMPYGIACGLGGGNWNIVYQILSDAAKYFDYNISLYKK